MTSIDLPDAVSWPLHMAVGVLIRTLRVMIFLEHNYTKTKERTANRHLNTPTNSRSKYDPSLKIKNPFRLKKNKKTKSVEPTFTHFNELPIELRCKIWAFASNIGRVVEVTQPEQRIPRNTVCQFALSTFTFVDGYLLGAPRVNAAVPAVLQVCQESRYEALRYYTLTLAMKDLLATGKGSYVNFEHDMLYFGTKSNFYQLCISMSKGVLHGLGEVKHLALGMSALGIEGDLWWFELDKFVGLETLCFLFKEPRFLELGAGIAGDGRARGEIELVDDGSKFACTHKVRRWRQIYILIEDKVKELEEGQKKPRRIVRAFKGVNL